MRMRTTLILIALNAIVAVLLFATRPPEVVERRKTLVPAEVELGESAESIAFSASRSAPAFALVRDARGRWRIDAADGPLASQPIAHAILDTLRRAPILPFDTGDGADAGLEPPQRTVTVTRSDGGPVQVAIGRAVGRGTFVRFGDEESIYLTSNVIDALLLHQPGSLRELRPFAFSGLDVHRLAFSRRRPDGVDAFAAERRWLTWFVQEPLAIRGHTRLLDGIVSAMIGLTRTQAVMPIADLRGAPPAIELTLATKDESVSADLWSVDQARGSWIVRIGDETTGFQLESGALRALLVPLEDLYDRKLFHDPAVAVTGIEWQRGTLAPIALERGVDRLWRVTAPQAAPADDDVVPRLLEDLVQLEADGVEPAGSDATALGFERPAGRIRVSFGDRVAETIELAGSPAPTHARLANRPNNVYRFAAGRLDAALPPTALPLLDRTVLTSDWRRIHEVDIVHEGTTYQFEVVGTTSANQWRRTPFTGDTRGDATAVRGQPMRLFLSALSELEADGVVAWNASEATELTGAPRYTVRFVDPQTGVRNELCIGAARPPASGIGDEWHPVWFVSGGLPGRAFVYRIGPDLPRRVAQTLR